MGRTKTKVKEKVEKVEETVMEEATPEIPETVEATEEEAQEFTEEYTETKKTVNLDDMKRFARVYGGMNLWKAFIPANELDADAYISINRNGATITCIDQSKISAGVIRTDVWAIDGEGDYAMISNDVDRIVHFKASEIEFKGVEVPTIAVAKGRIGSGEVARTVKFTVNLSDMGDPAIEGVQKTIENFEKEIKWRFEVKVKEFAKVVKEFSGGYAVSTKAIFMAIDGKLLLIEDGAMGIMVTEIAETFEDAGLIGKYATDYLRTMVDIVSKMGLDKVELRFINKDAPLWIHGENTDYTVDLLLAPNIDEVDEEYYKAIARALL